MSLLPHRRLGLPIMVALAAVVCIARLGQSQAVQRAQFAPSAALNAVHPSGWVQVRQGVPYTVPSGLVFVPTALGSDRIPSGGASGSLYVNGVEHCDTFNNGNSHSMLPFPPGLAIPGGAIVSAEQGTGGVLAQVWGFVVPDNGLPVFHAPVGAPSDGLIVEEGSPYVVPQGKVLAVTAFGSLTNSNSSFILVDNVVVGTLSPNNAFDSSTSPSEIPRGLSVSAGSTVEAADLMVGDLARVWGVLTDE